jgi:hypothetical protein
MAFVEDLTPFYSLDGFADAALWKGTETVNVIFDNAHVEQFDVSSKQPIVRGQEANFIGVQQGDSLVVKSVNYTIYEIEPDGNGEVILFLKKV